MGDPKFLTVAKLKHFGFIDDYCDHCCCGKSPTALLVKVSCNQRLDIPDCRKGGKAK